MQASDSKLDLAAVSPFGNIKWSKKLKRKLKGQGDDEETEGVRISSEKGENTKYPLYPVERWGHQAVVIDKYMYLVGGYIEEKYEKLSKDLVYRFDCETHEWENFSVVAGPLPEDRDSHSVVVIQNKMYLFGGKTHEEQEKVKNDLWTLSILPNNSCEWKKIDPTGNPPHPRESQSACVIHDRYMIIVGGNNGKEDLSLIMYDDIHIYDSQMNSWREVINKHGVNFETRESFAMVSINDLVYIFGGQGRSVGDIDIFWNDFYKLKFSIFERGKSESVEVIPVTPFNSEEKRPGERASHSMCVVNQRYILIIGGENKSKKLDDIWAYDTLDNIWFEVHHKKSRITYLKPVISHSSAVYQDQIVIFGGMLSDQAQLEDTLIIKLNLVPEPDNLILEPKRINACKNCEVVYNFTSLQKQKQLELEQALKRPSPDDEDNIRIDIDHERESGLRPEVFVDQQTVLPTDEIPATGVPSESADASSLANKKSKPRRLKPIKKDDLTKLSGDEEVEQEGDEQLGQEVKGIPTQEKIEEEVVVPVKETNSEGTNSNPQGNENNILKVRQPFISMSFLSSISNLLVNPFTAIALLVQNARFNGAKSVLIDVMSVPKKIEVQNDASKGERIAKGGRLQGAVDAQVLMSQEVYLVISDETPGFSPQEFIDVLYKLEYDRDRVIPSTSKAKNTPQQTVKVPSYGVLLKLAALRIGQSALFVSKNNQTRILNVALLSSNGRLNPNLQESVVFMFSIDQSRNGVYLTEGGDQNKRVILNSISHFLDEEQLLGLSGGNHLFIFELKRIPAKGNVQGVIEFNFDAKKNDLVAKKKQFFGEKRMQVEQLVDSSLSSYLRFFELNPATDASFSINGCKYSCEGYASKVARLTEINQKSFAQQLPLGVVAKLYSIEESAASIPDSMQGILLYWNGQLIGRVESNLLGSKFIKNLVQKSIERKNLFKFVGYVDINAQIYQSNLLGTGLLRAHEEVLLRESIKTILKSQRDSKKDNQFEPDLKKALKSA